ncbi:uncharacterized protein V1510DRAFT_370582 [Dipodascopsis tothii]|uniref:uncharacterized protein n=1 Tax=Dipodascopsis tothii TaxID=44089 RepID=UPI0034CEE9A0
MTDTEQFDQQDSLFEKSFVSAPPVAAAAGVAPSPIAPAGASALAGVPIPGVSPVPVAVPSAVGGLPTEEAAPTDEAVGQSQLTLRALVSSKEAGIIIGKQGKNVADLREETGVKAGVSKPVPGVPDRVLTVTGTLDGVSKAYSMAAQTLIDSPPAMPTTRVGTTLIRLLISHNQMGTIIGRQGLKIKAIQDECHVRMVASKEMLPNSTERIVEVHGNSDSIRQAVWEIGKCLVEDWQRSAGTILYNPQPKADSFGTFGAPRVRTGNPADFEPDHVDGAEQTQNISIPADMVGCIIGRGGTKIQEIRRISGARISIAKQPHDESGERMFTIKGTTDENEKALFLLYEQLEAEKVRRQQEQDQ